MQIEFVQARDLSEAWYLCIQKIVETGYDYTIDRGSYAGQKRKEFDFVVVQIKFPNVRPLIPDIPPGLGLDPPTSMDYVETYAARYLMTSIKETGEFYTYGEDLEKQIPEFIRMYQEDGLGTNQACMSVGDAGSIFLPDPQCLRIVDTRIKPDERKLHLFVYFRSWDLYNGFPANLGALQLMKEEIVAEISKKEIIQDGEIIACSKGLHLYDYAWDLANKRLYR